jgi:hypothetical protein
VRIGRPVGLFLLVRGERLTPELGDARLRARRRSAPGVRELTSGAPELHGTQRSAPLGPGLAEPGDSGDAGSSRCPTAARASLPGCVG